MPRTRRPRTRAPPTRGSARPSTAASTRESRARQGGSTNPQVLASAVPTQSAPVIASQVALTTVVPQVSATAVPTQSAPLIASNTKNVWIYNLADRELGQKLLKDLPMATDHDDIDEFWVRWSRVFLTAMKRCIPCKTVPIRSSTPWINPGILQWA